MTLRHIPIICNGDDTWAIQAVEGGGYRCERCGKSIRPVIPPDNQRTTSLPARFHDPQADWREQELERRNDDLSRPGYEAPFGEAA